VTQANDPNNHLDYTPVHVAPQNMPSITLSPVKKVPRELWNLLKDSSNDISNGKVLVSVLVRGKTNVPDVVQWKKWLAKDIPTDVAKIEIEAVFASHSGLCLLTLPIEVWEMVKDNDAFSFISYVESNNLLNDSTSYAASAGILDSRAGNMTRK